MVDILHRIGATASPEDVYAALTTVDGLAGWWTQDTEGDGDVGGVLRFRFGPAGGFDIKVLDAQPGKLVLWQVVDGPQEWVGTQIRFDLKQEDDFTVVLFRHEGWKEPVELGELPAELQEAARNRQGRPRAAGRHDQQLALARRPRCSPGRRPQKETDPARGGVGVPCTRRECLANARGAMRGTRKRT
jgi:uncharacterized protein YndB with AHSA1/START domain